MSVQNVEQLYISLKNFILSKHALLFDYKTENFDFYTNASNENDKIYSSITITFASYFLVVHFMV